MRENVSTNKTTTLAVVIIAISLATMAFALLFFGKSGDVFEQFQKFIFLLIPVTVGQLFLSRQNNEIRTQGDEIKSKLNGELDARLDAKIDPLAKRLERIEALVEQFAGSKTEGSDVNQEIPA